MADGHRVKLYGTAFSHYSKMVECALRLKGVLYDFVEEDLDNKSEAFLKLNPVHKKVPVLVVDGKPLAESLIILLFVDDVWNEPPLLPADPYRRAKLLFWADFFYQKILSLVYPIVTSEGEPQKKAAEEFAHNMATLENGVREDLWRGGLFVNGEKPGLLDVVMCGNLTGIRCLEESAGVQLVAEDRTPILFSAMAAFAELDALKELQVPKEVILKRLVVLRQKALASPQA